MPGPRRPEVTPYAVAFGRAIHARTHRRVVAVFGAQMGKSDTMLDIIGSRLDTSPVPILYVGPTSQMIREQWEPRVMELLDEAPTLAGKVSRGKRMKKTLKYISGVPLRLAHGRSSSALKSDRFGLALTDEADELMANLNGQGDPIGLIDMRGNTYADFVHAITSTPSKGPSEVRLDEESGLEFWADVDRKEVESTIWRLWLSGTRHHYAWPCPHCGEYFIPRFKCLGWEKPKDARGKDLPSSPTMAKRTAHLVCPRNGCIIEEDVAVEGTNASAKEWMNDRGRYVAPGQWVDGEGVVHGLASESWTLSYWASGLASPFKTWGEQAAEYVNAVRSGNHNAIQTVLNGGFGELYAASGGAVPDWTALQALRLPYQRGEVPDGVRFVTMGIDVQANRLVWTKRGWGIRQESWLIDNGELWGETDQDDVWTDLAEEIEAGVDGMHIRRAFVDSGFRPGKKFLVPEHKIYEFCRRYSRVAFATKSMSFKPKTPLTMSRSDVTAKGEKSKYGLEIVRLDSDFFKSWVHQRLSWPEDQPGGWHLHSEVDEDYCRQIVSEARIAKPSGGVAWVPRSTANHYLDAEALAYAAAYMLGVHRLGSSDTFRPRPKPEADEVDEVDEDQPARPTARAKPKPTGPTQTTAKPGLSALGRLNRRPGAET